MSWSEWARAVEVEPSIYASDFSRLGEQLGALAAAGARVFHFDTGDGHFIPEITIGPIVLASISPFVRGWGARLDCHLMVSEPERHFEAVAKAGGDSVTFHVEACDDPARAVALARELGLGVGLAFNPETPVADAVAAADGVDLVLCMSIHPGYSGQAFMPESLDRLTGLRAGLPPGGARPGGRRDQPRDRSRGREAGADLVVAGSAVFWHDDLSAAYRELAGLAGGARDRPSLRRAASSVHSVLALAVTGRGLVDPNEPVIRADDEGLLRGRRRSRRCGSTAAPFRLEAHLDRLTASAASIGLPAVERRRLQVLVGPRAPEGGQRRCVPPARLDGRARRRRSVGAGAAERDSRLDRARARARRDGRVAPRRPRVRAVASPGSEVDELRGEHGGRGRGAAARRRRGALRRRRRRSFSRGRSRTSGGASATRSTRRLSTSGSSQA